MEKRYQVFVSSTFQDLQDERQEVMQALLELDCIPSGMELFPAANDDQWSLIQKVIDDCDYYIVIVGGRYGSTGPDGLSYTEMEYRYALERGKPIIGFLHKDPGQLAANRTETSAEAQEKLRDFRALVQQKLCRFWDSPADLGSQVSRSLVKLIKTTEAVGWVRGDLVPDVPAAQEILRLRRRIEELEGQLESARTRAPAGTEALAQGSDAVPLHYSFKAPESYKYVRYSAQFETTWDALFRALSPLMINEASDQELLGALSRFVEHEQRDELDGQFEGADLIAFQASIEDFQTIKVQFRALGLITKSVKPRSVKDTDNYWSLTPYGDSVMTRLRAVPRSQEPESEPEA